MDDAQPGNGNDFPKCRAVRFHDGTGQCAASYVAFGWYSGWNAEGAFMKTSLAGIPDSMDIVSIWDNGLDLSYIYARACI